MPGRENERGFAGNPAVDLAGSRRDDDEASEILALVGEISLQHLQPVDSSSLLAGDGRLGGVGLRADFLGRLCGVHVGLLVTVLEPGEEVGALGKRLVMRVDAPNRGQGSLLDAQQAMLDGEDLFSHDVELGGQQEVVDRVDAAGRGVFDRQHGVVGLAVFDGGDHVGEALVAFEGAIVELAAEELFSGQEAVGALDPLVGDAEHLLGGGVEVVLEEGLLGAYGVLDDLVEDTGHKVGIEAELTAGLDECLQNLAFPRRVAKVESSLELVLDDLPADGPSLREQLEKALIETVDVFSALVEIHLQTSLIQSKGSSRSPVWMSRSTFSSSPRSSSVSSSLTWSL